MSKRELLQYAKNLQVDKKLLDKIIQKHLKISSKDLLFLNEIKTNDIKKIQKDILRLESWESIEYILQSAEFYSLDFYINKHVLIPRNDTELLVEKSIEKIEGLLDNISLIDIWTWSWNIPISIKLNTKNIKNVIVIEKSKRALNVAKYNFEKHKILNNFEILHWNLLSPLLKEKNDNITNNIIMTANLPYIKDWDFENMSKETVLYEPHMALFWWKDTWFELYEKLLEQVKSFKNFYKINQLFLFIEIGFDQYKHSKDIINKLWLKAKYYKDNSWIYRCIEISF